MTMARYQKFVLNEEGQPWAGVNVEVRIEASGALAALYSDRSGTTPLGNPTTTDANGYVYFHASGAAYKIRYYVGASGSPTYEHIDRYVAIGRNAEADSISSLTEREVTAAGDVVVSADDADVILINKTVGEATTVILPDPSTTIQKVRIVDRKYDAATNNITIVSDDEGSPSSATIMGAASYVIDSNGGSIELKPLADGTGWV